MQQNTAARRWAPAQRPLHWALVLVLALGWWSGSNDLQWHKWVGYTALLLLGLRFLLGFGKHPHVRWSFFGQQILRLTRARAPGPPSVLGPFGALSAIMLLLLMAATAVTGWMLTLERYVGEDFAEDRHEWAFNLLIAWTAVHAFVNIFRWLRQRWIGTNPGIPD